MCDVCMKMLDDAETVSVGVEYTEVCATDEVGSAITSLLFGER